MITLPAYEESEAATNDLTATPLQRFIHNYEPGDGSDNEWRKDLSGALDAACSTLAQKVLETLEAQISYAMNTDGTTRNKPADEFKIDITAALRELFQREGIEVK